MRTSDRRRGLAGGTFLGCGLGLPSTGPWSVLTVAAVITAASKRRQDSAIRQAPESAAASHPPESAAEI